MTTITPQDLFAKIRAGEPAEIIDVRTPVEYRAIHASGAKLIPLDQLDARSFASARSTATPLYLICKSGQRATKAAQKFQEAGYTNVAVIAGGTDAWAAAGCPIEKGQSHMSLERQVRIAAGSIVLLGVILTATLSIWFLIIPAFIGAGLTFAGLTDWCGMGLLLAKAPWNRIDSAVSGMKGTATCQPN